VTISGQVDGIVPTTVTIDAVNADIIGNSFYFNDFSLAGGANSLLIHAEDAYGNTAETTLNLTLDTTVPVLNVSQPVNGSTISARSTVVQGTVTDEFLKELRVNGVVCTVTDDAFTTAVALNEGTNTIQVIAEDTAGNTETVSIVVTCDDLAPVITVTGPDANAYLNTSPVTITGRAEDADLAGVNVNGAAAALNGNEFTKTGVDLVEGENQVTIEAADSAGNQSTNLPRPMYCTWIHKHRKSILSFLPKMRWACR
jgi:hypothetical protein